jgi:hypothetical protein
MKIPFTFICVALLGFSLWGAETNSSAHSAPKLVRDFHFEGPGSLDQFLKSAEDSFGVNLNEAATIPATMRHSITVPKMRLNVEAQNGLLTLRNVLYLYNSISEKGDPSLGRWIMEPASGEPQTILLVPTGPRPESSFAVRAFSFPSSNNQEADRIVSVLQQAITTQQDELQRGNRYFGLADADLRGVLSFHAEAGILVASGGKIYVEMATSIIQAYKEKMGRAGVPIPEKPESDQP